ncbi:hypothetical protein B0T26DRAFT_642217 [Lasiosphaeria miniovina]|uniref:Uncharacterized protein n=1 Tax=Lasiosphaeria miniovina TaxID=1954250 RepID=A0AA40AV98_9PEZI|nr:uncharacterized protein B0T26DRAFT_642217 [Lasiosphaeria miniovina]KAK0722606.1 hypothetical protein B0T26DRAFT_642217 [Lasiosphaeria miniovina]
MTIQIKCCAVCRDNMKAQLQRLSVPYTEQTLRDGKKVYTINITNATDFPKNSLAEACWKSIEFTYHHAVYNGNMVRCSNS